MKITCQSCQSKYTVSDEKVQGKTVKIKCRKCGATILVNSSGVTSNGGGVANPMSLGGAEAGSYLVNVNEGDQRSMTLAEIVTAYNEGVVNAETYIWSDGIDDWQPLGQVEAVVGALNGPAAAEAPAPEPAPAASPAPAPAAAAAAATETVPRAAVRRDTGRRSQDLFGGGMAAQTAPVDDVATSAPLFTAPAAATGQRDENSTLFSLSALTAKAAAPSPSGSRTTASKEDSGLIDLKALAASAGPAPAASALLPDAGGLFPLGAPIVAAPAGSPASVTDAPPAKNRTPIYIAIGGVVAISAIVGVFMVMKGSGEVPVPSAQPTAAAPPPPTATQAPAAETPSAHAAASAAPSASAEAAASPGGKTAKSGGGHRGGGGPRPNKGGAAAAAKEAPAAPAKPARGNCACPPGDLMCAMKCSAGK